MTSPFAWLGVVGVVGGSAGPGPAAVTWSLGEKAKFPNGKPTAARIAEYFEPAVRDGKKLNMMAGNWCAAGVCFAASRVVGSVDLEKAGLPHAYRVSGKELEDDAIKHKAWLSAAEVGAGARPAVGDVAIYNRGDPNDWTRHVSRVVDVRANGYTSIDANGPGAAWAVVEKEWQATNLRGFIRYPTGSSGVTSKQGLGAGLLMVGAAGALLWATLRVGKLRRNPVELLPPVGTRVRVLPLPGQARWNKANAGWESPVEGHDSRGFVEIRDRRGRLMRLRPWEIESVR